MSVLYSAVFIPAGIFSKTSNIQSCIHLLFCSAEEQAEITTCDTLTPYKTAYLHVQHAQSDDVCGLGNENSELEGAKRLIKLQSLVTILNEFIK